MKTRLIRIGNSRGVRLPKPLIEEAGLTDEVELKVRGGAVIIARTTKARTGWAEAAKELRTRDGNRLLYPPTPTRFDDKEWKW